MMQIELHAAKRWQHYCYHCFARAPEETRLGEWLLNHAVFHCTRLYGTAKTREEAAQLVATWYPSLQVTLETAGRRW